ncbi:Cytochrome b561 domain-containing protein [Aphelenchoides fujianensis]|nr:Cytochrome b561 domain-containing protein [Aphelenchoides fujianensis]
MGTVAAVANLSEDLHRTLNVIALFLMFVGLITVFVAYEWTWKGPTINGTKNWSPGSLHTFFGVVACVFAFGQPLNAFFRCSPTHPKRPFFDVFHRMSGTTAWICGGKRPLPLGSRVGLFQKRLLSTTASFFLYLLELFVVFSFVAALEYWTSLEKKQKRISENGKKPNRRLVAIPRFSCAAVRRSRLRHDGFYGRGAPTRDPLHFSDFQIDVLDDEVENAKGANFESGFNVAYLRNLTASFLLFDWKQHQNFLNTFVHKITQIEGVDVHFVKSELPEGFGPFECGRLLAKLMDRLGTQLAISCMRKGGLGGEVASAVALFRPTAVRGLSLVNPAVDFSGSFLLQSAAAWRAEALLKYPNLRKFERLEGGELVALENPKLLAELIFSFVEEELLKANG